MGSSALVIGEPLESVEHFPSNDLFTSARNQPVTKENRGPRIPKPANADLRFPEPSLEFLPIARGPLSGRHAGLARPSVIDACEPRCSILTRIEQMMKMLLAEDNDMIKLGAPL